MYITAMQSLLCFARAPLARDRKMCERGGTNTQKNTKCRPLAYTDASAALSAGFYKLEAVLPSFLLALKLRPFD